jgi:hypothetical protein
MSESGIRVDLGMSAAIRQGNPGNAGCPVLPVDGTGLDVIQALKRDQRDPVSTPDQVRGHASLENAL